MPGGTGSISFMNETKICPPQKRAASTKVMATWFCRGLSVPCSSGRRGHVSITVHRLLIRRYTLMATNELLNRLGIDLPIIQGPMGGGPSTPELVAAVSNAGGLGSLGAAYLTPDQIVESIQRIRSLTEKPFQVNLFSGGWNANAHADSAPMLELLAEIHQ